MLDLSPDLGRLPREVETALFRILQESLNNIHRHSGSPRARFKSYRSRWLRQCNHGGAR